MLRMTFAIVYLFLAVFLIAWCVAAGKKKSKMSLPVIRVIAAGTVTAFFYALYLMTSGLDRQPACFFMGLYYMSVEWLTFFLTEYAMAYTEAKLITTMPKYIIALLVIVDSVSIIVNNFTGHVFGMIQLFDDSTGTYYWTSKPEFFMKLHLMLCYIMVALTFVAFVYKMIAAPRFYKRKYSAVFIMLAAVIVVNAAFLFIGLKIDFSVLIYAVLGPLVCYFTLFSTPRSLAMKTHSYVIEKIGNGIICFDIDGSCVYVNSAAKKLFSEWRGDEDIARIEQQYADWLDKNSGKDNAYWDGELKIAGVQYFLGFEYCSMLDDDGTSIGSFFRIEDKTEDVKRLRDEQYRATHDRLTGLYNREGFFDEAKKFLREHADEDIYVLASNVKDFKLVNELFGNEKGDEVLIRHAKQLNDRGTDESVTGRISGDRFCRITLKKNFNEKLLEDNINELCSLTEDGIYKMHIYVGVYEVRDKEESIQTMYDKSNIAIERIKGDYQKTIVYYNDSDMDELMHEKSVVAEFDKALGNQEFCIYLQPQVDNKGNVLGAEALVRWMHPKKGLQSPDTFIGILEKAGLIHRLDNYIWDKAAELLAKWKKEGFNDCYISVNISAKDFYYLDLYEIFTGLIKKYDIEPTKLHLEITETVIMSDVKLHMEVVDKLQQFGFHIEIDDFGSGYSSLNTLKDIKADLLKIDMLFLHETENQARSRKILNSIISMANALNMPVITEGVETKNQLDFLSDMGCGMFQGFYFSKPVSVEIFEEKFLKKNNKDNPNYIINGNN